MYTPRVLLNTIRESDLVKNVGITFSETVLTKGMNFVVFLMLTRALGPEDFGKYSFIFVTVALFSALFDFGMENTAVRFSAREHDERQAIFGLYTLLKAGTLFGLIIFFVFFGEFFLGWFAKPELAPYLPFLLIGLVGESLYLINDTYLQAEKRFKARAFLNIVRYVWVLGFTVFLLVLGKLVLNSVVYIFLIPSVFSLLFLPRFLRFVYVLLRDKLKPALLQEMTRYEGWMLTYSVANNLMSRVDLFLLAIWVGYESLGIYNAAFQLCAVVSFLPFVIGKVLLPTMAESSSERIFRTAERLAGFILWGSLVTLLLLPLSHWVIPWLLSATYAPVVLIWQILFISFLLSFLSMPYEQALYAIGDPRVLTRARYIQLLGVTVVHTLTIPIWGIYAAAINTLLGRGLYLLLIRKHYLQKKGGFERLQENPFLGAFS